MLPLLETSVYQTRMCFASIEIARQKFLGRIVIAILLGESNITLTLTLLRSTINIYITCIIMRLKFEYSVGLLLYMLWAWLPR